MFYLDGTMELSICLLMTVASFMLFGQLQSAGNTSALLRLLDVSIDKVEEIDKTPVMDEHGKPTKPENFNIVLMMFPSPTENTKSWIMSV